MTPTSSHAHAFGDVIDALAQAHQLIQGARALPASVERFAEQLRQAGRRLEVACDAERPVRPDVVIRRVIEPDVVPLCDGLARLLGPVLSSPTPTVSDEQVVSADGGGAMPVPVQAAVPVVDVVMGVVAIFERQLGPALQRSCRAPAPRFPIPWRTPFDASVHRVVERGRGPVDVVIAVERAGREGISGRLEEPAWVVVGGGQ
jgi:hypothetical protein